MKTWNSRPILVVIGVVLLAFVGCSGDSPTEPSKPGSGTTVPPSDSVTVSVSVSSVTPTSAVVTATIDGGSAADGTAVEFETSAGTFLETGTAFALRATENGRASVTVVVTGGEKTAVVRVRSKSTIVDRVVNFLIVEIPEGGPVISSVTPPSGSPGGGYVVTIRGRNFFEPVRVFFGDREAVISSYTAETPSTEAVIKVVVPSITFGVSEQARNVAVTVVGRAGQENEVSGSLADGFRYLLDVLTPAVHAVAPSSGPNEGNTRITIFGEGFQSPLVVYFGSGDTRVDLEVITIGFGQIIAVTPPAAGLGSAFVNSSVDLTVHNIASNTKATLTDAFRYGPEMQIVSVSPTQGSVYGGTRVTIYGFGFDDPVAVTLAGIPAQVIRVTGTELTVIASAPPITDCAPEGGGSGEVTVTNIEDAQTVSGGDFTYIFNAPTITLVSPIPVTEGGQLSVTVNNPGTGSAAFRFTDSDRTVTVFPALLPTSPTGSFTYTMTVPSGLTFETEECVTGGGAAGIRNVPTPIGIGFENLITGCEDEFEGLVVIPLDTTCVTAPTVTVAPSDIAFGNQAIGAGPTAPPQVVTITNPGSVSVSITSITSSNPPVFVVNNTTTSPVPPGGSTQFTVAFDPDLAQAFTGTVTIVTSAGDFQVSLTGTGTP